MILARAVIAVALALILCELVARLPARPIYCTGGARPVTSHGAVVGCQR